MDRGGFCDAVGSRPAEGAAQVLQELANLCLCLERPEATFLGTAVHRDFALWGLSLRARTKPEHVLANLDILFDRRSIPVKTQRQRRF